MRFATCHPDRKHHGKGLCRSCYNRQWELEHPDKVNGVDRKEYFREYWKNHKKEFRQYAAKWKRENPEKVRALEKKYSPTRKWRIYGITKDEYERALKECGGKCPACGKTDLVIDHDHKTGKFRGLICRYCNLALGAVRDNIDVLWKLIEYLEKSCLP